MAVALRPDSERGPDVRKIFYPSSDGKPVGETDDHIDLTLYNKGVLVSFFNDRPDVYVSGNNVIYYEEDNPKARVSPDGYVVFGVPMRRRDSYFVWQEGGKLPNVVFEYTSRGTRKEDTGRKFKLYEQTLCVPEYFLFDPKGEYLKPHLQGYQLVTGRYQPLALEAGRLYSEQLGLAMEPEGAMLRFIDLRTGKNLPLPIELADEVEAQQQRLSEQRQRISEQEQRLSQQQQRLLKEQQRLSEQQQRAEAAESEVARLRAELEALRDQKRQAP